jgi:hypothetical protein
MNEILDKDPLVKAFEKYRITPFLFIGSIVIFLCIGTIVPAIYTEVSGQGTKGTILLFFMIPLILLVTIIVLFIDRKIVTKQNIYLLSVIEILSS